MQASSIEVRKVFRKRTGQIRGRDREKEEEKMAATPYKIGCVGEKQSRARTQGREGADLARLGAGCWLIIFTGDFEGASASRRSSCLQLTSTVCCPALLSVVYLCSVPSLAPWLLARLPSSGKTLVFRPLSASQRAHAEAPRTPSFADDKLTTD